MRKIVLLSAILLLQYSLSIAQFAGGSGTESDPYQVSTIDQLQEIQNHTDKHFIQLNDIDASETLNWNDGAGFIPIGDDVVHFTGSYDGSNFIIDGLFINTTESYVGLFGYAENSTLKNIQILNANIAAGNRAGILSGRSYYTSIDNVHTHGKLTSTASSGVNFGGVTGETYESKIHRASSDVDLISARSVGGLVGTNNNSTIDSSRSLGSINGSVSAIGGLVGDNIGFIHNSTSKASVNATSADHVGGLVGNNRGSAIIMNASALGDVFGTSEVGGLVGVNQDNAQVESSFSTGKVTGDIDVGGAIGLNGSTVKSSYFDLESSAQNQGIGRGLTGGIIGLTSSEMKGESAEANMSELSFDSIWGSIPNDYPKLLWSIPYFQIQSVNTNAPITEGQQLSVEITVNNIGGLADTQTVVLKNAAGDTLDSSPTQLLESRQTQTLSLLWQSGAGDEGAYTFSMESEYDRSSFDFNVRTIPATVELTSPTYQQENISVLPVLAWSQAELADYYQLQISTVPDFSTTILDIDNVESLTYEATDSLDYLSTYYWRVRGKADIGDGDWSDSWSFTTIIQSPELVALQSPDDASSNISTTPSLQWVASERADHYRIQLSESGAFTEILQDSSGFTDLSFTPNGLQFNTTYHWRVKAINEGGESEWSTSRSFFTEFALPTPVLEGPEATAVVELPVTFFWQPVTDADNYTLELSTDQSFQTVLDLSNSTGEESLKSLKTLSGSDYTIAKKISSLDYSTTYYWRVKAINSSGMSDWSEVRSIQTEPAPIQGIVILLSPENSSADVSFPAGLSWQRFSDASHYDVELSKSSDFLKSRVIKETEDLTAVFSVLEDTTTYFWRVRATINQQKSDWSNVWSFSTELRVPEIPVWKPEDQSKDISTKPLIEWGSTDRAESYHLQLAKLSNPDFTDPLLDIQDVADTSHQVSNDLESGETYVWRVRAGNKSGFSDWSESLQFTTEMTTSIDETNGLPDKVSLNQNYPNPFNPATTISFTLPENSKVSVEVFNSLGQRVAELVNEIKSAGVHVVSFDASSLSSGIYLIRMSTPNQTFTRKMTLLK